MGRSDIRVIDRSTGRTTTLRLAHGDWRGAAARIAPAVSADGRYVAFVSDAGEDRQGAPSEVRSAAIPDALEILRRAGANRVGDDGRALAAWAIELVREPPAPAQPVDGRSCTTGL
jgi:hypothetical protein